MKYLISKFIPNTLFFTLILFLPLFSFAEENVCNITEYGAVADGETVNTEAIQTAIDDCFKRGGGKVYIPTGEFLTGTLKLKSNINLYLESGAELIGSSDLEDYTFGDSTIGVSPKRGVIFAEKVRNVSITGNGTINGNDRKYFNWDSIHHSSYPGAKYTRQGEDYGNSFPDGPVDPVSDGRPGRMIEIYNSENIRVSNVSLINSPNWTLEINQSNHVVVENITINNTLLVPNSDGLHITTSRNVRISNCDIQAGDDALIVSGFGNHEKAEDIGNQTGEAKNITVTNCVLKSRSSGIRVGHGSSSISNCVFSNIVIYESNRAIGVFLKDNVRIDGILFNNISIKNRIHTGWWGNGEPIHVSAIANQEDEELGEISNVKFSSIRAESETGIVVYGKKKGHINDLSFENIDLSIKDGEHSASYGGNFDLRSVANVEDAVFEHDIPGLFGRHINGLSIEDFNLSWGTELEEFFTSAISLHHSSNITIDGFTGKQAPVGNSPTIDLKDISDISIRNCKAKSGTKIFLRHQKLDKAGIFTNNNLIDAGKIIVPGNHNFLMGVNKTNKQ